MDNEIEGRIRITRNADASFLLSFAPHKGSGGHIPVLPFESRDQLSAFLTEKVGLQDPEGLLSDLHPHVILKYSRAKELGLVE